MFLNYIKVFLLNRLLNNRIQNVKTSVLIFPIKTVGLLIDESYFFEKEALIKDLIANGISEINIKTIVYTDKFKKDGSYSKPTFGMNHLNWRAEITEAIVLDFLEEDFDLLISYYDIEKSILKNITHNSKAKFKAGFSTIDKRLNHLMVNTNAENYKVFVQELFKYLKILNKI
jgi:hypothetical protein